MQNEQKPKTKRASTQKIEIPTETVSSPKPKLKRASTKPSEQQNESKPEPQKVENIRQDLMINFKFSIIQDKKTVTENSSVSLSNLQQLLDGNSENNEKAAIQENTTKLTKSQIDKLQNVYMGEITFAVRKLLQPKLPSTEHFIFPLLNDNLPSVEEFVPSDLLKKWTISSSSLKFEVFTADQFANKMIDELGNNASCSSSNSKLNASTFYSSVDKVKYYLKPSEPKLKGDNLETRICKSVLEDDKSFSSSFGIALTSNAKQRMNTNGWLPEVKNEPSKPKKSPQKNGDQVADLTEEMNGLKINEKEKEIKYDLNETVSQLFLKSNHSKEEIDNRFKAQELWLYTWQFEAKKNSGFVDKYVGQSKAEDGVFGRTKQHVYNSFHISSDFFTRLSSRIRITKASQWKVFAFTKENQNILPENERVELPNKTKWKKSNSFALNWCEAKAIIQKETYFPKGLNSEMKFSFFPDSFKKEVFLSMINEKKEQTVTNDEKKEQTTISDEKETVSIDNTTSSV